MPRIAVTSANWQGGLTAKCLFGHEMELVAFRTWICRQPSCEVLAEYKGAGPNAVTYTSLEDVPKCNQGHPRYKDYVSPKGQVRCRQCKKENAQNWRRKQKEQRTKGHVSRGR